MIMFSTTTFNEEHEKCIISKKSSERNPDNCVLWKFLAKRTNKNYDQKHKR